MRSRVRGLTDLLFGYDFFLSYAHDDGRNYPRKLKERLEEEYRFRVFLDEDENTVEEKLGALTRRRIRMTQRLVVIARPAALDSKWVRREIGRFVKTGRRAILVDVNDTVATTPDVRGSIAALRDRIRHAESIAELDADPSDATLLALNRGFQATRRDQRRVQVVFATALVLAALATFALVQWREAVRRSYVSLAQALAVIAPQQQDGNKLDERAALLARQAWLFHERYDGDVPALIDNGLREVLSVSEFSRELGTVGGGANVIEHGVDGWLLASGSSNQAYRVHRIVPGRPAVEVLNAKPSVAAAALALAEQGQLFAVVDGHARIVFHDLAGAARAIPDLSFANGLVRSIALAPDGSVLAVGMQDGSVEVWEIEPRRRLGVVAASTSSPVVALRVSPDAARVAFGTAHGRVVIARLETAGIESTELQSTGSWIESIGFAPNGRQLATAERPQERNGPSRVRIWSVAAADVEPIVLAPVPGWPMRVRFGPRGRRLAVGTSGGRVCVWDSIDADSKPRITSGHRGIVDVGFDRSGRWLLGADMFGAAREWRIEPFPGVPRQLAAAESLSGFALVGSAERVVVHARYRPITVHDVGSGAVTELAASDGDVLALAADPAGRFLAAAYGHAAAGDGMRLWRLDEPNAPPTGPHGNRSTRWSQCVAFAPDGAKIYWGGEGRLFEWAVVGASSPVVEMAGHSGHVTAIVPLADGKRLVAVDQGGTVREWDLETRVARLLTLSGRVTQVDVDPTGRWLVAAEERRLLLWDLRQDREVWRGVELDGVVTRLRWEPNGDRVAVGLANGVVRISRRSVADVPRLDFVGRLRLDSAVQDVAWHPTEPLLVCGGADGRVVVQIHSTRELARAVCSIVTRNLTRDEWRRFVGGDVPYERTCPDLRPDDR